NPPSFCRAGLIIEQPGQARTIDRLGSRPGTRSCLCAGRTLFFSHMIGTLEIEKMSMTERLQAMEQLWDALCRDRPEVSSPDWHGELLKERKERAERGAVKFLTLGQLRSRLHGSS